MKSRCDSAAPNAPRKSAQKKGGHPGWSLHQVGTNQKRDGENPGPPELLHHIAVEAKLEENLESPQHKNTKNGQQNIRGP